MTEEERILQEEAERLEKDRQKWITDRKRQRAHFETLKLRMNLLNKGVGSQGEIWNNIIEPKVKK
jgi:hypothetical protein